MSLSFCTHILTYLSLISGFVLKYFERETRECNVLKIQFLRIFLIGIDFFALMSLYSVLWALGVCIFMTEDNVTHILMHMQGDPILIRINSMRFNAI